MHEALSTDDLAAEGLGNRLMPQTHAHQRQLAREMAHCRQRYARRIGIAGARRKHDCLGVERLDAREVDLVVLHDLYVCSEHAKLLHDVVREGIVVVDHQYHSLKVKGLKG